jgi:hypothetical protein
MYVKGSVRREQHIVQKELLIPANWCRSLLSHPHMRACTYKKVNDTWLLNIYHTDKLLERLEDAYQMKFVYRVSKLQPAYFDIALIAHKVSSHTKNPRFGLEAIPLEKKETFIHLRYSFGYSAYGYFLMKIFGGTKFGFSRIGIDSYANPVYAEGLRGLVERDVACRYLAIPAHLDALEAPSGQRSERQKGRIS